VRFDIYGPDVLIANKMESGGKPGYICVSKSTKELLETLETINYTFEDNKLINIKSLGIDIPSYFLRSNLLQEEELQDESMEEGAAK
jgi:class 3 adenylate cyclase